MFFLEKRHSFRPTRAVTNLKHLHLQLETAYSTEKIEKPGAVSHKMSPWRKIHKTWPERI